ncbi:MAG TPA: hypothetical protein VFR02_07415 [bacterium]|nr:hypothetical protein [bacterium]
MEKIELNTDLLADMSGKVTEQSIKSKLPQLDAGAYRGKHVVVKGCAPTWAVMMLQHRLEGVAAGLSFKLFDGKEIGVW